MQTISTPNQEALQVLEPQHHPLAQNRHPYKPLSPSLRGLLIGRHRRRHYPAKQAAPSFGSGSFSAWTSRYLLCLLSPTRRHEDALPEVASQAASKILRRVHMDPDTTNAAHQPPRATGGQHETKRSSRGWLDVLVRSGLGKPDPEFVTYEKTQRVPSLFIAGIFRIVILADGSMLEMKSPLFRIIRHQQNVVVVVELFFR